MDSHCHLDFIFSRLNFKSSFEAFRNTYHEEFDRNFEGCIAVFCKPKNWKTFNFDTVIHDKKVWLCFGVHPHFVEDFDASALKNLLKMPRVVGLGEIGLDYSQKNHVNAKLQKSVFRQQLELAVDKDLPICLHIREADEDGLEIMSKAKVPKLHRIHLHCFNSSWEICQKWLERFPNMKIGLTPLVLYDHAHHVQEVAKKVPLSRVVLETDSPYFYHKSFHSVIGMSHPGFVQVVAKKIATIKGLSLEEVLATTCKNTLEVYDIQSRCFFMMLDVVANVKSKSVNLEYHLEAFNFRIFNFMNFCSF